MERPEIDTFVLHETTSGAPDSPGEVRYRRGFERGDPTNGSWLPTGPAGPAIERLLAPLGAVRFAAEHLGRAPAHMEAGAPERFAELFSFRRLAELLATRGLPPEQLDVYSASRDRIPPSDYSYTHPTRGGLWLDHEALFERVARAQGSMVLNALHAHDRRISALADELHVWSGLRVKINAYLTPAGGKTFGWHWDGHDVFIVQVEGRKRWRLFEPVMQHPLADGSAAAFHELRERRTPLRQEVILERGDVLYLPGGVPHDVDALDQRSLHLSVGLSPIRWAELLRFAFEAALHEEVQRPETRAPATADEPAAPETLRALVDRVAATMRRQELDELLAAAASQHSQTSIAAIEQRWSWHLEPPEIDQATTLRLVQPARVSAEAGLVVLVAGERVLVLHPAAVAAAEALIDRGTIMIGELPGLSPGERARFAVELIERGVAGHDHHAGEVCK